MALCPCGPDAVNYNPVMNLWCKRLCCHEFMMYCIMDRHEFMMYCIVVSLAFMIHRIMDSWILWCRGESNLWRCILKSWTYDMSYSEEACCYDTLYYKESWIYDTVFWSHLCKMQCIESVIYDVLWWLMSWYALLWLYMYLWCILLQWILNLWWIVSWPITNLGLTELQWVINF